MREESFNVFTIAMVCFCWIFPSDRRIKIGTNERIKLQEKQTFDVFSLIDLQGQMDREYVVGFYFSDKAPRKALKDRWPTSPEDNLERLANAGFPHDRGISKCRNCGGEFRLQQPTDRHFCV